MKSSLQHRWSRLLKSNATSERLSDNEQSSIVQIVGGNQVDLRDDYHLDYLDIKRERTEGAGQ